MMSRYQLYPAEAPSGPEVTWSPRLNLVRSDSTVAKVSLMDAAWEQLTPCGDPGAPDLVLYIRRGGHGSWWNPAGDVCGHLTYERIRGELGSEIDRWQQEDPATALLLAEVFGRLSRPSGPEPLILQESLEIAGRQSPSVLTPYGRIPLPLAAPEIHRVLALAYLLVRTWLLHHAAAAKHPGREIPGRISILCDELDDCRTTPAAVYAALLALGGKPAAVRIVATTTQRRAVRLAKDSWNAAADSLFELALEGGVAVLEDIILPRSSAWAGSDPGAADPLQEAQDKAQTFIQARRRWVPRPLPQTDAG
ncbi:MAG: hypothetical protein JWO82_1859 [Akkermansiaceae bacterium]|nr:hypothetical protein [Akkermansiaceae bacterium]